MEISRQPAGSSLEAQGQTQESTDSSGIKYVVPTTNVTLALTFLSGVATVISASPHFSPVTTPLDTFATSGSLVSHIRVVASAFFGSTSNSISQSSPTFRNISSNGSVYHTFGGSSLPCSSCPCGVSTLSEYLPGQSILISVIATFLPPPPPTVCCESVFIAIAQNAGAMAAVATQFTRLFVFIRSPFVVGWAGYNELGRLLRLDAVFCAALKIPLYRVRKFGLRFLKRCAKHFYPEVD